MYSFLMAENRTDFPAITVCGADGAIFQDIPIGERTKLIQMSAGSVRLEIYDNFQKLCATLWVPLAPYTTMLVTVYTDHIQLTPLSKREA